MAYRRTEKSGSPPATSVQLKGLIVQALQTLHGQVLALLVLALVTICPALLWCVSSKVGASIPVDILHYSTTEDGDGVTHTLAILRAPHKYVM